MRVIPKYLFVLVCFIAAVQSYAQLTEEVEFDLKDGQFKAEKLTYLKPLKITGDAEWKGAPVDGIELTIRKQQGKLQTELKAEKFDRNQLSKQIQEITDKLKVLVNYNNELSLVNKLKDKESDWAVKFTNVEEPELSELAMEGDYDKLKKALTKKIKYYQDLVSDNQKKKIKLDASILEKEEKLQKDIFYEVVWKRSDDEDEFSFALPQKLKMGEDYSFEFKIIQKNTTAFPVDSLVNSLWERVKIKMDKDGSYEGTMAKNDIAAFTQKLEKEDFQDVVTWNDETNQFESKGLRIDVDTVSNMFLAYITKRRSIDKKIEGFEANIELIKSGVTKSSIYTSMSQSEKDSIEKLLDVKFPKAIDKSRLFKMIPDLSDDIKTKIEVPMQGNQRYIKDVSTLREDMKEDSIAIFDYFEKVVKLLYVKKSSIKTKEEVVYEGDVEGIPVGTTYGIGLVSLDNWTEYVEWFQFIGANFRLDSYDNRLAGGEAYNSWRSRFSVMVAIATTSDMQYQGQQLGNTRLGFKPVFGLNYEPVKHMNIGGGVISFVQEPINNSQRNVAVRPYITLNFDFNLFNYLIQKQ